MILCATRILLHILQDFSRICYRFILLLQGYSLAYATGLYFFYKTILSHMLQVYTFVSRLFSHICYRSILLLQDHSLAYTIGLFSRIWYITILLHMLQDYLLCDLANGLMYFSDYSRHTFDLAWIYSMVNFIWHFNMGCYLALWWYAIASQYALQCGYTLCTIQTLLPNVNII